MKKTVLSIKSLEIGYINGKPHRTIVADHLNLNLYEGEFICLVGPNGAGKSTLLRTLTGLQPALGGEICLNGKELQKYSGKELAYEVSVVLTSPIEVGAMTVNELVAMGRFPFTGMFDRITEHDWQIVHESLALVGMLGFEERMIHRLSDGERQKVMIARALAQEPRLLVLDEPTAYLDLPGRVSIMNLLHELATVHGRTVLTSTHDLDLAMRSADQFWLMASNGHILQAAPEDLVLSGDFQRVFERDRINFDVMNGHFSVSSNFAGQISLQGDGENRVWTERALERIGFQVFPSPTETELQLNILEKNGERSWELSDGLYTKTFRNLASLVEFLRAS